MRHTLLAFLCVATVIAYIQRLSLVVPTKVIEGELGLGPEGMGIVMAMWYWGYALFQLPSGWIADRLGSKPALILFAVLWSVLTGVAGLATGFVGLLLLWGMMGCAQAGIFPCCTKAIGATFPRTEQAFASGMLICCMALGASVSPVVAAFLLQREVTWQQVLALYAVPGLVWAVAFALFVPRPDAPAGRPPAPDAGSRETEDWHALPPLPPEAPPVQWSKLVTDSQMQLLCLQQLLRACAMAFFFTWFPRFLQETKNLSQQEAGSLAFWPPFVGMFGGLAGGVFSDWLLKRTGSSRLARQGMTFAAMVVCAVVALVAYFTADPLIAVLLISIAAFCGMAGGVSGYSVAIAYGGKRVATVFSTMNMCGNFGAAMFPWAVGRIVKHTGDWNYALLLFAALFALDAVCWAVLNPKGTLFDEPEEPT
jgi:MFS family permease